MTAEEVAKNRLTRVSCEDLLTAETQSSQRFFYSLFSDLSASAVQSTSPCTDVAQTTVSTQKPEEPKK
jgi:hypothetical protein